MRTALLSLPELEDIWTVMDKWFNTKPDPRAQASTLATHGLKTIIKTPHNLYAIKDKDGNVTENVIKVVITPFKRDEVKVDIRGDVLTVTCGTENKTDTDDENMIYHGISSQCWEFSLRLTKSVDKTKITAKIDEGVLTIKMPFVKPEATQETITNVKID